MKKVLVVLFFAIASSACNRSTTSSIEDVSNASKDTVLIPDTKDALSVPVCIKAKIDSIKKLPIWNPPAEISEYEYGSKKVYMLSAPCCDFFTTVVDANCNYICAPSGGFTGQGDRKCPNFIVDAKKIRLVWRDERAK
jgi:hypothetical protein